MAEVTWPSSPSNGQQYVAANGSTYTYNSTNNTWTVTSSPSGGGGGGTDSDALTFDADTGRISAGTLQVAMYLYRYLHVRFSANSNGSSFVTNPASVTGTTIYIGLANRSSTVSPTNNTDYNWTSYTWSSGHNVFYRSTGGYNAEFLTSTQSSIDNAIPFANGDSPIDFDVPKVNRTNIIAGAVDSEQLATDAVIAGKIAANAVTAGTVAANVISATQITSDFGILSFGAHDSDTDSILQSTNFIADSEGWQIKGDGTAEFDNVIIRQGSEVRPETIRGDTLTRTIDTGNDGLRITTSRMSSSFISSNMTNLGSATWNTNRGNLVANSSTGQFLKQSNGIWLATANPSSGTLPSGNNVMTYAKRGHLGGIVLEGAGAYTMERLQNDTSGYRFVVYNSRFTVDSNPAPSGALNVTFYSMPSSGTIRIGNFRCGSSGMLNVSQMMASRYYPFQGWYASTQYAFNSIAFTMSGQHTYRVKDTDGTTVYTGTGPSWSYTTNGSSVTSTTNCNVAYRDDLKAYVVQDSSASYLGEVVAVHPDYTVEYDVTYSTSGTNSNFLGFNFILNADGFPYQGLRSSTVQIKESFQDINNVGAFLTTDQPYDYAALIAGGAGLWLPPTKIFEGSAVSGVEVFPNRTYIVEVGWNVSSPGNNTVNTTFAMFASPQPGENWITSTNNNRERAMYSDTDKIAASLATFYNESGSLVGTLYGSGSLFPNGAYSFGTTFAPSSSFSDATIVGAWQLMNHNDL